VSSDVVLSAGANLSPVGRDCSHRHLGQCAAKESRRSAQPIVKSIQKGRHGSRLWFSRGTQKQAFGAGYQGRRCRNWSAGKLIARVEQKHSAAEPSLRRASRITVTLTGACRDPAKAFGVDISAIRPQSGLGAGSGSRAHWVSPPPSSPTARGFCRRSGSVPARIVLKERSSAARAAARCRPFW